MKPGVAGLSGRYKPKMIADSIVSTDARGLQRGDVVPMIPGSRFRIFDIKRPCFDRLTDAEAFFLP